MKVLVCGAGGFIGSHISRALRDAGHEVAGGSSREMDFTRMLDPAAWLPHLKCIDAVINAVGVLRDTRSRPLDLVHDRAPRALFEACAQAGVRRVIHVSALGIDGNATLYARSKRGAELALRQLRDAGRLDATILRPSIVFGRGGASSSLFMGLARLPVLLLPRAALTARVQPVAVDDLATVCATLLPARQPLLVECVGPTALTLAEFIGSLRRQLGHLPAAVLPLPAWMALASARCGDLLPFIPWCTETMTLLQQDNIAPAEDFARLLARPPVPPEHLVAAAWHA